ncbi:MAG: hypothetical protein H6685_12960 [Deltaproteobacteria bacterium]|nr:hypothetical protein [Deltaproteobacteria bacterium]
MGKNKKSKSEDKKIPEISSNQAKKVRNDKLSKYPDNSLRLLSTRKLVGVSFDVLDLRKAEELAQELDDIELQIEDKEKT